MDRGLNAFFLGKFLMNRLPALFKIISKRSLRNNLVVASQETGVSANSEVKDVVVAESPMHAALRRLAMCQGATFGGYKNSQAILVGYHSVTTSDHYILPSRIPELLDVIHNDRALFAALKAEGGSKVFLEGDLRFELFSPFGEFRLTKPTDRPALPVGMGGKSGYMSVKETVTVDFLLESYDALIGECEKALRAGTQVTQAVSEALVSPAPTA